MFHYKRFSVNPIEENCYIIWDDITGEGAIVDCGAWNKSEYNSISHFIKEKGIKLKYSLQTHMHFDHCLGLCFIEQEYGLTPMCHALDVPVYQGAPEMVYKWFGVDISDRLPDIDDSLNETTTLNLGDVNIQVLHTPGHTPGGLCFYIPDAHIVVTGDTLFNMSVGRTDLPGGDHQTELDSIRTKLFSLPTNTKILPGHGQESIIAEEKEYNPYLQ